MSGLFGKTKHTSTSADKLAGMNIQTSAYGGEVALIYGTDRVAANLVWYNDFKTIPHTTTTRTGKGGGGSVQSDTTYTYTASTILALGEGAIGSINRVWQEKILGTTTSFGLTVFTGTRPQTAWSFLTTNHPSEALSYAGKSYIAHPALDLGDTAVVKNFTFEVLGLFANWQDGSSAAYDANPADIIVDYLTSIYHGVPDFPAGKLSALTTGDIAYDKYCKAFSLFLSPTFNAAKPALEDIRTLLLATNSEAVWGQGSSGLALKIIPYGDTSATAHGATYTPDLTPLFNLTPNDFLVSGSEDPIICERQSPADSYNVVPVKFRDRALDYDDNTIEDPIQEDIDAFGLRRASTLNLDCIKLSRVAMFISRVMAQRYIYSRNIYTFKIGWKYALLEPMDFISLTEPKLGLVNVLARIKEIDESSDGVLTIKAMQWPSGIASAATYATQAGDGGSTPDTSVAPGDVNTPVIFDVPVLYRTDSTHNEILIAASGASANWGGCEVWVSSDNTTYTHIGGIPRAATHGVLTATFASGAAHDTTNTLAVNLTVSKGTLASVSAAAAVALQTLWWVEGEMGAFQTATLTSTYHYDLTILERGAYGTTITSHATSDRFTMVDSALFRYTIPPSLVGTLLYFKFPSKNIFGGGLQDISGLSPYTFTPTGTAVPTPTLTSLTVTTTRP